MMSIEPGKIIQISTAQGEDESVEELFLDENGVVWQWEYKHVRHSVVGTEQNERGQILVQKYLDVRRRLVPVKISTDWESFSDSLLSQQWIKEEGSSND